MDTQTVTYGELTNGDKIFLQGYLFEISNITEHDGYKGRVIRFTGHCVGDYTGNKQIKKTMYDGGTYGAYPWVTATIAKRS